MPDSKILEFWNGYTFIIRAISVRLFENIFVLKNGHNFLL